VLRCEPTCADRRGEKAGEPDERIAAREVLFVVAHGREVAFRTCERSENRWESGRDRPFSTVEAATNRRPGARKARRERK
jgi:hypothetical protein